MMKAVVCTKYGSPEVLKLTEVATPTPKDNEVCIRINASTVTAADYRVRSFTVPASFWLPARLMLGIFKPRKSILGMEVAGEITAIGAKVDRFKVGDVVFAATLQTFGGYAEYVCLPQDGPICINPKNLSPYEAAALPIGARTALHYLRKANIQPNQKVLIYGASGSVGTYAVQMAKHFGAQVTAVCSSTNREMVASLGAQRVLDYNNSDFFEQLEEYDVVFVAIDKIPFSVCRKALKEKGIYLNVTAPLKSPAMLWASISSSLKIHVGENSVETADDLRIIKEWVEQGVIQPVIDRTYPLEEVVAAHRYADRGHKKGNVVLKVV